MALYSFGIAELTDGIGFTVIAVGLFAISEIVKNLESGGEEVHEVFTDIKHVYPTVDDLRMSTGPILRGTAGGSFFPTLTLGIPGSATMALMLGALTIQGIAPGPQVMTQRPDLFWGLIASMWIGNAMLVILTLPLVGMWVKLLKIPYRWLFPSILMFCAVGNYSINNSSMDLYLVALFGVLGYVLMKLECEPAPIILAYVLGPLMEENLRRALLISRGDPSVFFTRPISLAFMIVAVIILITMILPAVRKKKEQAYEEGGGGA